MSQWLTPGVLRSWLRGWRVAHLRIVRRIGALRGRHNTTELLVGRWFGGVQSPRCSALFNRRVATGRPSRSVSQATSARLAERQTVGACVRTTRRRAHGSTRRDHREQQHASLSFFWTPVAPTWSEFLRQRLMLRQVLIMADSAEVASLKRMVETLSAANAQLTELYLEALSANRQQVPQVKTAADAALEKEVHALRAKTAEYDEIERLVHALRAGKAQSVAVA